MRDFYAQIHVLISEKCRYFLSPFQNYVYMYTYIHNFCTIIFASKIKGSIEIFNILFVKTTGGTV